MTLPRLAALVAVLAGIALLGWLARTPIPSVSLATAARAELAVRVTTNGVIEPVERAEVRARIAGRVIHLPDPGSEVAQGELLLRIADTPVAAELATAESERLSAEESLHEARRRLARARRRAQTDAELLAKGGLTPERQRETQADLESAEARLGFLSRDVPFRIAALETRIRELKAQVEAAELRAPFAGTVYATNAKAGETVTLGQVVLRFADLQALRVRANIDQVDLGAVKAGQSVAIRSNAYPGRVWSARVSELIPHVVKKQARLVAEGLAPIDPPAEGLIPGMTVDVEVVVDSGPSVLQIPADAVSHDARGAFVWRWGDGRLLETRVQVGRSSGSKVEVSEGLSAGDRVVRSPSRDLVDGVRAVEIAR